MHAYKAGQLDRDFVAVMRFQGPRANGMPELHALTPALANLQDAGLKVALVTDGRMSGASGKVPAAIHVSPEILAGGPLGLVRDGDIIRVDATTGTLQALVPAEVWAARKQATADLSSPATSAWAANCLPMFRNIDQRSGAGRGHLPAAVADPHHRAAARRRRLGDSRAGFRRRLSVQGRRNDHDPTRHHALGERDPCHRHRRSGARRAAGAGAGGRRHPRARSDAAHRARPGRDPRHERSRRRHRRRRHPDASPKNSPPRATPAPCSASRRA